MLPIKYNIRWKLIGIVFLLCFMSAGVLKAEPIIVPIDDVHKTIYDIEALSISILREALEIERHLHAKHRVFGKNEVQTATVKADTTIGAWFYPYEVTSAADSTFGTAVQVLGSEDTPMITGMVKFDLHEAFITGVNDNSPYVIRLLWGVSAAVALADGCYTDTWVTGDTSNPQLAHPTEIEIAMPKLDVGTLVWLQIANAAGAQTMSILFGGLHEYPE